MRKQEKQARQAFFAGVEELVHQVFFDANVAGEQIRDKHLRKFRLLTQESHHGFFLESHDGQVLQGSRRGNTQRLSCQTSFAEEVTLLQDCNYGFLTALGNHGELDSTFLNIEDRISCVPLRKHRLLVTILMNGFCSSQLA